MKSARKPVRSTLDVYREELERAVGTIVVIRVSCILHRINKRPNQAGLRRVYLAKAKRALRSLIEKGAGIFFLARKLRLTHDQRLALAAPYLESLGIGEERRRK